jgi:hypothetical protein
MGSFTSELKGLIGALLIGCSFSVSSAWAGFELYLLQEGPNLVASGSGRIDLTGLVLNGSLQVRQAGMEPSAGLILTGPAAPTFVDEYTLPSGPSNFGSGQLAAADSGTGDEMGVEGAILYVPQSFISDHQLNATSTYDNQSFSSLGITPGVYTWRWGGGADQVFYLIAVPEPRVGVLLGAGLLVLLGVRLRRLRVGSSAV